MTVVEFFERESHVENIISTLLCTPDKVIFLGDNKKKIDKIIKSYEKIALARGINTVFDSRAINRNSIMSIVDTLEQIIEDDDDCVIDLSGGDDLALVAIGVVYADNADRIQLHRFSITNNTMTDCDSDGKLCAHSPFELTVEELVAINGGRVIYTEEKSNGTYKWDFNRDFVDDVYIMWSICKRNPHEWNTQLALLSKMIAIQPDPASFDIRIDFKEADTACSRMTENKKIDSDLYKELARKGVLDDFRSDSNGFSFRFKNDQIKKCLSKAGQVFELFLAICASELKDDNGNPVYTDILSGVFIDWDGEIHPGTGSDVENEIDLILMKGLMPVFISCKNGSCDINELFKLSVVASHFGGKYVRAVLAGTEIDKAETIELRAKAMGINPWIRLHKKPEKDLYAELSNLWRS